MAKSGNANAQGDAIKGDLGRVRRRSKDIEHDLNSLAEAAAEWNMLAGGGRNRRNSKDYSDEALLEAFQEIDTDKSGSIEEAELESAIRKMDPNASQAKVRDMLDFADSDGDGQCVPLLLLPTGRRSHPDYFPEPPFQPTSLTCTPLPCLRPVLPLRSSRRSCCTTLTPPQSRRRHRRRAMQPRRRRPGGLGRRV